MNFAQAVELLRKLQPVTFTLIDGAEFAELDGLMADLEQTVKLPLERRDITTKDSRTITCWIRGMCSDPYAQSFLGAECRHFAA